MSVNLQELTRILKEAFPNSDISVIDTVGDGNHLEANIISDLFEGKSTLQRHKLVYDALGSIVGNEIHALALNTTTNDEKKVISSHKINPPEVKQIDLNDELLKKIDDLVKSTDVVLFMKGTKEMPMCGFSSVVNHILELLQVNFIDVDVMADYQIRDKIKEYSDWPTIPQLYIKGNFIGGCDIIRYLYSTGELQDLLQSYKIPFSSLQTVG